MPFVAYFILCVLIGYLGRNSRIGFWGVTFLSIFFTPVLTGMVLAMLGNRAQAN